MPGNRKQSGKRHVHGQPPEVLGPATASGPANLGPATASGPANLGPTTASGPANLAPGITAKPGSRHTIYDTFDDEKRVI